jgi:hypothetical protein
MAGYRSGHGEGRVDRIDVADRRCPTVSLGRGHKRTLAEELQSFCLCIASRYRFVKGNVLSGLGKAAKV